MLNDKDREKLEKLLLDQRATAVAAIQDFDRNREEALEDQMGELSTFRLHPADIGTEAMEQEKAFLLASAEGRHLDEIDEALRRLYKTPEKFGICEKCGKEIALERLEVIPEARLCAECQKQSET